MSRRNCSQLETSSGGFTRGEDWEIIWREEQKKSIPGD
jgi:hypothetical protein